MTRSRPLQKQLEDLRSDVEVLRLAQDRLQNLTRLQIALMHTGLEVLGYDGPVRYELGRTTQCELCGGPIEVSDRGYELRLRSKAWGTSVRICAHRMLQ